MSADDDGPWNDYAPGGKPKATAQQSTAPQQAPAVVVGGQAPRITSDHLKPLGLSEGGAAGVFDNLMRESGGKTTDVGDGGTSIGGFQWHAERKTEFLDWAKANKLEPFAPDTQVKFLQHDLETKYPTLYAKLKDPKTTRTEAEDLFQRVYERPKKINTPSRQAPGFKVSDQAVEQAMAQPGVTVRYMRPRDYLDLSPEFEGEPWTDRQGKSLKASLDKGEPVDTLPSLLVRNGKVTDQDGRHRAQAALEAGVDEIPVVIRGVGAKTPTELVGTTGKIVPFDFKAVEPFPWQDRKEVKPSTTMERIGTGMLDPIHGAAQLMTHLMPEKVLEAGNEFNNWLRRHGVPLAEMPTHEKGDADITLDRQEREREAEIQAERGGDTGIDWARMAGNVASPANFLAAPIMRGAGMAAGAIPAASGAIAGAMQPVTDGGNYWGQKAEQAGLGAVGGVVGDALGSAAGNELARIVAPGLPGPAGRLAAQGVRLTPGQMAGGAFRRGEEALESVPLVGSMVQGAQRRAMEDFNRAAINSALRPIRAALPRGMPPGREAIGAARDMLSAAYDRVLNRVTFRATPQFAAGLRNLMTLAREMPPAQREQFRAVVQNRLMQRMAPTGTMDGRTLKQVESELGNFASQYHGSPDAAQRQLGDAISEAQRLIRENLIRTNPNEAAELSRVNEAFARFVRVEGAAARRPTSEGVFTPGDLLGAVKSADPSRRRGAFARGDALMQGIAEDAQHVIGRIVPNSGTPERLMWAGLASGAWLSNPAIPLAAAAAAMPYSAAGTAALRRLSTASPAARNTLAQMLRNAGPYVAGSVGASTGAATQSGP